MLKQILKKICDHPLLLTKRAAEDVLDGMDSMLDPQDANMAAKLAMHIADVADEEDFNEQHNNISCKISFILSLLVRNTAKFSDWLSIKSDCPSLTCFMLFDRIN